jgi:hypothetical protein
MLSELRTVTKVDPIAAPIAAAGAAVGGGPVQVGPCPQLARTSHRDCHDDMISAAREP